MDNERIDRRVRKTKKKLYQGFTELMQQKNINEITVRELCDLCDINRGTFYLHYKDIYDILDQIEKEMFEEFHTLLSRHPVNSLNGDLLPLLIDFYEFVADNAEMCMVLLGKNGDIAFLDRLKEVIKHRCLNDFKIIFNTDSPPFFEYYCAYIVAGCVGLLQKWLESGMNESPENMALFTKQMITNGSEGLYLFTTS